MIHPGLSRAFPPDFAHFGETLGLPCAEATPMRDLLAVTQLPQVVARYSAAFPAGETRAAVSLWSQYYLLALVPCAAAAALTAGQDLPLALDGMAAVLDGTGQPCRLCVPHSGGDTVEACPMRRLGPLLRQHLEPLSDALAGAGLPRPIFWSNAAAVLGWSLRVIEVTQAERATLWAGMAAPRWADGGTNPFAAALGSDPAKRRVCCLRYRLGTIGRCGDCPGAPGQKARDRPGAGRPSVLSEPPPER